MKRKNTIIFENRPEIISFASVAGKKESEGPLGKFFDITSDDDTFGGKCWEEAESRMQMAAFNKVLEKAKLKKEDVDYIVAGDLLGQLMASSFGMADMNVPFLGVYGACSTIGEALILGSFLVDGGYADRVMALTSSHFATAEKEFRFPLAYGNQRPLSATTTVTGSGAVLLGVCNSEAADKRRLYVEGVTVGRITDFGINDANNMGAAMAPAAFRTIKENFEDCYSGIEDFDCIITGDLGNIGSEILYDMFINEDIDIDGKHIDCGREIYDIKRQDAHSGGSGCGCAASTLCGYIFKQMLCGQWSRILFVPTGALMSTVSLHEGNTIPAIAHAVIISVE